MFLWKDFGEDCNCIQPPVSRMCSLVTILLGIPFRCVWVGFGVPVSDGGIMWPSAREGAEIALACGQTHSMFDHPIDPVSRRQPLLI